VKTERGSSDGKAAPSVVDALSRDAQVQMEWVVREAIPQIISYMLFSNIG